MHEPGEPICLLEFFTLFTSTLSSRMPRMLMLADVRTPYGNVFSLPPEMSNADRSRILQDVGFPYGPGGPALKADGLD